MRRILLSLLALLVVSGSAVANEQAQIEMLKEVFRTPIPQWKEVMGRYRGLLNSEFFTKIERRVRWSVDHNHIDDAFRFALLGDIGKEVVGQPGNYRIDLAEAFFNANNDRLSEELVDNILITNAGNERALFLKAKLIEKRREVVEAHRIYTMLAQRNFRPADCWYLAGVLSITINNESRAKDEWEKAKGLGSTEADIALQKLAEANSRFVIDPTQGQPTTPDSGGTDETPDYMVLAKEALREGKLSLAESNLRKAINANSRDVEAHVELGALYYRMGDLDPSVQYLDRAVELDGQRGDAWRFLANSLERRYDVQGNSTDLQRARDAYQKASKMLPNEPLLETELERIQAKG